MATLPLILSPEALNELTAGDDLLIVAVVQQSVFDVHHIPGSVLVEPAELMCGIKPAVGKLPSKEKLDALFSRIGLSSDKHIIAYDDEGGGWAGRLIWTLDVIGHERYSYLDGGLIAWLKMGLPLANANTAESSPESTSVSVEIHEELLLSKDEVLARIDDEQSIVWDARAPEEYEGNESNSASKWAYTRRGESKLA